MEPGSFVPSLDSIAVPGVEWRQAYLFAAAILEHQFSESIGGVEPPQGTRARRHRRPAGDHCAKAMRAPPQSNRNSRLCNALSDWRTFACEALGQ